MGIIRDNPIIHREFIPGFSRRGSGVRRILLVAAPAVLAVSLAAAVMVVTPDMHIYDYMMPLLIFLSLPLSLLLLTYFASQAIVRERLAGSWEALMLSRLKSSEIVFGKLIGIVLWIWLGSLVFLPALLVMLWLSIMPHSDFIDVVPFFYVMIFVGSLRDIFEHSPWPMLVPISAIGLVCLVMLLRRFNHYERTWRERAV